MGSSKLSDFACDNRIAPLLPLWAWQDFVADAHGMANLKDTCSLALYLCKCMQMSMVQMGLFVIFTIIADMEVRF